MAFPCGELLLSGLPLGIVEGCGGGLECTTEVLEAQGVRTARHFDGEAHGHCLGTSR